MSSNLRQELRPVACVLLSVGDELVSGLTVDRNSAWLSRSLAAAGVRVTAHATVADDQPAIERAISEAATRADLLIITGGIGPTRDDLTREALAAVMGRRVIEDAAWIAHMEAMFHARRREMKAGNRKQAGLPEGARLLWNPVGTAAGVAATLQDQNRESETAVFVLPGVPKEMRAMFEQHVAPWVEKQVEQRGGLVIRSRAVHTFGIGESDLAARLDDLLQRRGEDENLQVGTTASGGIVSLRAYARAAGEAEARKLLDAVETRVRQELGDLVVGVDEETLPGAVAKLLQDHPRQPVVSLAESCTGGWIAKLITDLPGSSDYFHRGYVTYSNAAKHELLGVPWEALNEYGAVSLPVVEAMAGGARETQGHGIALAVSGVAGPGGGTGEKPVGTVCIALAAPGGDVGSAKPYVFSRQFRFSGDREMVRLRSAYMALMLLRLHLLGRDLEAMPL